MWSLGSLVQYARCPNEKKRIGHRLVQREDLVKTQGETAVSPGEKPQKKPNLPTP